jgi:hypothetical protein
MRGTFSFRKMITVTAFAAAAVSLMAPAHADESTDLYIRDALVGQSSAPVDEDRTTDGWLHSYIGTQNREPARTELPSIRDSLIGQVRADDVQNVPFIRDSQIGQAPAPVSGAEPAVGLSDSGTDWVLLSGGLLLAFLMGVAGTLTIQNYRDMRHRTA